MIEAINDLPENVAGFRARGKITMKLRTGRLF